MGSGFRFGDLDRHTSRLGHAVESATIGRGEHDHAPEVPGSATPGRGVAQNLRRAARRGDLLQFALGEESDKAAVG